jgi:NAD+ synthase (glutamine-hydrolysing)
MKKHSSYKVALAQVNAIVGDVAGNTEKIIKFIRKAKGNDADLVIFPELAITGYPQRISY